MGRNVKSKTTIKNAVDRISRRGRRPSIKGQLGQHTILTGNEMLEPATQLAGVGNTSVAKFYPMLGGTTEGRESIIFAQAGRCYQKYLYLPGTKLVYQPAVGLQYGGIVYCAYLDNPELIANYHAAATSARLTTIKNQGNMKCFPVWQEFTYSLTQTPRYKQFPNDQTLDYNNTDQVNRSVQGVFVVGLEGLDTVGGVDPKVIGRVYLETRLQLEELSSIVA